ncbi:hypothetical protein AB8Z38_31730 [Bradyrhizobium sp. LLZ17]|uniref:TonB-dependent receptor-like beta-barrel domain-containing protein n=1 Tax=Bradyrhizobium sp. LLZ17 TaxID=3239388 RepID=A0AB39XJ73_9BRAD
MAQCDLIVTDVTSYGDLFCVAGWDRVSGRMIRPEPPGANVAVESSRFWSGQYAGPGRAFDVGNVVRFTANPADPNFPFPHATEDRIVNLAQPLTILETLSVPALATAAAGSVSPGLEVAFDNELIRPASGKAYVLAGKNVRSLGAVEIPASKLSFYENDYDPNRPKLRAKVTIGTQVFDLSVPALAARTRWKNAGLAGLRADLKECDKVHIRVGLSRPLPHLNAWLIGCDATYDLRSSQEQTRNNWRPYTGFSSNGLLGLDARTMPI